MTARHYTTRVAANHEDGCPTEKTRNPKSEIRNKSEILMFQNAGPPTRAETLPRVF